MKGACDLLSGGWPAGVPGGGLGAAGLHPLPGGIQQAGGQPQAQPTTPSTDISEVYLLYLKIKKIVLKHFRTVLVFNVDHCIVFTYRIWPLYLALFPHQSRTILFSKFSTFESTVVENKKIWWFFIRINSQFFNLILLLVDYQVPGPCPLQSQSTATRAEILAW